MAKICAFVKCKRFIIDIRMEKKSIDLLFNLCQYREYFSWLGKQGERKVDCSSLKNDTSKFKRIHRFEIYLRNNFTVFPYHPHVE